ncbi:serine/arginine repetitive matrix protein 2 isoform X3 [Nematostella vectensis]|uniref:serine/arginine repetitive matrix protein 2 isoform X3 n=1 Tax=Nematostella vectensis TaxID=45351 RepID=UPI0020779513|nr:serine/arginine repetitive matrix protein 2 isoform X3 [Nematostella vectensis]
MSTRRYSVNLSNNGSRRSPRRHRTKTPSLNELSKKFKTSPKGKRRLEFQSKKPLKGKSFYLDLNGYKNISSLTSRLQELGGKVEEFLSKDITFLITNRKDADGRLSPRSNSTPSPGIPSPFPPSKSSSTRTCLSPYSPDSPYCMEPPKPTPKESMRGKTLAKKATLKKATGSCNILANAVTWGVTIINVDKVQERLAEFGPYEPRQATKTMVGYNMSKLKVRLRKLKPPFIKVVDKSCQYKPLFQEFKSWPTLNFDSPVWSCPFDSPKTIRDLEKAKQPKKNDHQEVKKPKKGYCECCRLHYEDLDVHLRGDHHQAFARDDSNYTDLDSLIRQGPSLQVFLDKIKFKYQDQKNTTDARCRDMDYMYQTPVKSLAREDSSSQADCGKEECVTPSKHNNDVSKESACRQIDSKPRESNPGDSTWDLKKGYDANHVKKTSKEENRQAILDDSTPTESASPRSKPVTRSRSLSSPDGVPLKLCRKAKLRMATESPKNTVSISSRQIAGTRAASKANTNRVPGPEDARLALPNQSNDSDKENKEGCKHRDKQAPSVSDRRKNEKESSEETESIELPSDVIKPTKPTHDRVDDNTDSTTESLSPSKNTEIGTEDENDTHRLSLRDKKSVCKKAVATKTLPNRADNDIVLITSPGKTTEREAENQITLNRPSLRDRKSKVRSEVPQAPILHSERKNPANELSSPKSGPSNTFLSNSSGGDTTSTSSESSVAVQVGNSPELQNQKRKENTKHPNHEQSVRNPPKKTQHHNQESDTDANDLTQKNDDMEALFESDDENSFEGFHVPHFDQLLSSENDLSRTVCHIVQELEDTIVEPACGNDIEFPRTDPDHIPLSKAEYLDGLKDDVFTSDDDSDVSSIIADSTSGEYDEPEISSPFHFTHFHLKRKSQDLSDAESRSPVKRRRTISSDESDKQSDFNEPTAGGATRSLSLSNENGKPTRNYTRNSYRVAETKDESEQQPLRREPSMPSRRCKKPVEDPNSEEGCITRRSSKRKSESNESKQGLFLRRGRATTETSIRLRGSKQPVEDTSSSEDGHIAFCASERKRDERKQRSSAKQGRKTTEPSRCSERSKLPSGDTTASNEDGLVTRRSTKRKSESTDDDMPSKRSRAHAKDKRASGSRVASSRKQSVSRGKASTKTKEQKTHSQQSAQDFSTASKHKDKQNRNKDLLLKVAPGKKEQASTSKNQKSSMCLPQSAAVPKGHEESSFDSSFLENFTPELLEALSSHMSIEERVKMRTRQKLFDTSEVLAKDSLGRVARGSLRSTTKMVDSSGNKRPNPVEESGRSSAKSKSRRNSGPQRPRASSLASGSSCTDNLQTISEFSSPQMTRRSRSVTAATNKNQRKPLNDEAFVASPVAGKLVSSPSSISSGIRGPQWIFNSGKFTSSTPQSGKKVSRGVTRRTTRRKITTSPCLRPGDEFEFAGEDAFAFDEQ